MTTLGGWSRMPIRAGGGRPRTVGIYKALLAERGDAYSQADTADANLELRALSYAYDRAMRANERAVCQRWPITCTDLLPDWEQRLGVTPLVGLAPHLRRAVIDGIIKGTSDPEVSAIQAAVSAALDGATVTIVTGAPPAIGFPAGGSNFMSVGAPALTASTTGGALKKGLHYVRIAAHFITGSVDPYLANDVSWSVDLTGTANTNQINVSRLVISGFPASPDRIDYFLSVAPNADSCAFVGSQSGGGIGGAVNLLEYPRNIARPYMHHLGIQVSAAVAADSTTRQRVDSVLRDMLPAHTTYNIITSSPFIIGTSLLGFGAL